MSFLSWLRERLVGSYERPELPDLRTVHEATERSRQERRRAIQQRRELMVQIRALEKEIEILRDQRGWR